MSPRIHGVFSPTTPQSKKVCDRGPRKEKTTCWLLYDATHHPDVSLQGIESKPQIVCVCLYVCGYSCVNVCVCEGQRQGLPQSLAVHLCRPGLSSHELSDYTSPATRPAAGSLPGVGCSTPLGIYVGVGSPQSGPHACAGTYFTEPLPCPTPCLLKRVISRVNTRHWEIILTSKQPQLELFLANTQSLQ